MPDPTDIVTRLRNYDTCTDTDMDEAADRIERLRAELVSTTNKLTAERDEARRIVCRMESEKRYDKARRDLPGKKIIAVKPELVANEFGWFCFCKEEP